MYLDETQLSRGAFFYLASLSHNSIIDLAKKRQSLGYTDAETCPLGLCLINQIDLEAGVFAFVLQPQKARKMSRLSNSELKRRNDMFVQGMLWCAGHKQFEPVKDFRKYNPKTRSGHTNFGYRFYCTRYASDVQNPARADKHSKFFKDRNTGLKKYWVELGGGKCQRCGFNEFVSALEFHHVYPALKKGEPSKLIFNNNKEKAWRELDKCCLLCSICHRTYKALEWRAEFIKRDGLLGWTIGAELPLDDKRYESEKPPAYNQAPLPLFAKRQNSIQQLGLL